MKIQAVLLPLILLLTACGGSSSDSAQFLADCREPLGEERIIVQENFGEGGDCHFQPIWDFVEGGLSAGLDSCSLVYILQEGVGDEQTPAQVQFNDQQFLATTGKERQQYLHLSWQEYFEPGFEFAEIGQKLARIYDAEGGFSQVNVAVGNSNTNLELLFVLSNRGEPVIYSNQVTFAFGGVPVGEIIYFDLEVLLPTQENRGFARLRYAGQEVLIETDEQVTPILQQGCMAGFSGFWVGGNFSNAGRPASRTSVRYIDSVAASVR